MNIAAFILVIWISCACYAQTRGKVRHRKLARRITGHGSILAPVNCLFYFFSKVKSTPYIDLQELPELNVLSSNWQLIRDEAAQLNQSQAIKASDALNDIGFNSFFKTGWKRFYLKWYGSPLESAKSLCPKTVELLETIPTVKAGMFAMLPAGANLKAHSDPYAGSLRYHLGLITPNSNDCFISVDGEDYSWRDGEAVIFDETYIHSANNKTDENRIILFLDIKRPVNFFLIDWLNTVFSNVVMAATVSKNTDSDKVGGINKAFHFFYQIRKLGKWIKRRNKLAYYLVQYAIYAYIIYLLFF